MSIDEGIFIIVVNIRHMYLAKHLANIHITQHFRTSESIKIPLGSMEFNRKRDTLVNLSLNPRASNISQCIEVKNHHSKVYMVFGVCLVIFTGDASSTTDKQAVFRLITEDNTLICNHQLD